MQHTHKYVAIAAALLAAGMLAGCGNLSRDIAKDGAHAGQLVWPNSDGTNALAKHGTFPNLDNLKQVQSGLTKNQVMALIGPPQFGEGLVGVREWNYVFNFRGQDGAVSQCEFKILFSDTQRVGSTYWHPEACKDVLNPPAPVAAAPAMQTFTLSTGALFGFDQYRLADIKAAGKAQLDDLARKLNATDIKAEHVSVIGYTDRLGNSAYNQKLSQQRADTVRTYLVAHGVDAGRIDAEGRGAADPVVTCDEKVRADLIACLAPNRRVVVKVGATH